MAELVECVPNISEGRRPEVIEAVAAAARSVAGAELLDVESDADHNRSVLTLVGTRAAVAEAAFRVAAKASELIDLRQHSGEHPRMGSVDVVPFIPVEGVTMAECVQIAREVGARIGAELGIPVFLYEEAAARSERRDLSQVRKGQFEGLREAIGRDADRVPDFGPPRIHPSAGAIAVGARTFLIAFNVNLRSNDLQVAEAIAKAVRHSSGGFRFVKAMGVELKQRGIAQVSMNLTDFTRTPMMRVFEAVRREAERYGVEVAGSELVGLVPSSALHEAAAWSLRLEAFAATQVIENRVRQVATDAAHAAAVASFTDRVAAATPTPGGGSVAALAGALGASLALMVSRLTLGKSRYADVQDEMGRSEAAAAGLRRKLEELIEADAASFEGVLKARRLVSGTDEEKRRREQAIREATLGAARVPLEVMAASVATLELLASLALRGNKNASTDAAAGAIMARAAVEAAGLNVDVNLASLDQAPDVQALGAERARLLAAARGLESEALAAAASRASG